MTNDREVSEWHSTGKMVMPKADPTKYRSSNGLIASSKVRPTYPYTHHFCSVLWFMDNEEAVSSLDDFMVHVR